MDFSMFSDEPAPSNLTISVGVRVEPQAVRDFFAGRNISDITRKSLESYPHDPTACLTFMTPEAYAFFLPAFMRIVLDEPDWGYPVDQIIVSDLLAMAEGRLMDKRNAIESIYSKSQLERVKNFLVEMSARYSPYDPDDDAQKALSLYWNNF